MTEEETQAALDALETILQVFGKRLIEADQIDAVDALCELVGTIHAALTAQEQIDALYGIIESQKQTHDALIKMNKELLDACKVALGHMTGGMDGDWRDCDPIILLRDTIYRAEAQKAAGE